MVHQYRIASLRDRPSEIMITPRITWPRPWMLTIAVALCRAGEIGRTSTRSNSPLFTFIRSVHGPSQKSSVSPFGSIANP